MEAFPLLVIKESDGQYLATFVTTDGGSYVNKFIGNTPGEAAEYIVEAFGKYGKSLDVAIPEHLSIELPNKCDTSSQLLKY